MTERFEYLEIEGRPRRVARRPAVTVAAPLAMGLRARLRLREIIGSFGHQLGQFYCPAGVAVDRLSTIYVSDSYNHRIQIISSEGDVFGLGQKGSERGCLLNPRGLAVDATLHIYVVEQGNHRVQKFNQQGRSVMLLGGYGRSPGRFICPTGLAIDLYHNLYVADTGNSRIQSFTPTGTYRFSITGRAQPTAPLPDGLHRPRGVAVDEECNVYVADTMGDRVVKFDASGKPLAVYGQRGLATGCFTQPVAVAVDSAGFVFVLEMGGNRLQRLSGTGSPAQVFTGKKTQAGRLSSPEALCLDAQGSLYLADTFNHRLLRLTIHRGGNR